MGTIGSSGSKRKQGFEQPAPKRSRMLHVFAGADRAGNFEHAGRALNVPVDGVDLTRDPTHDVLQPPTESALLAAVEAGEYDVAGRACE